MDVKSTHIIQNLISIVGKNFVIIDQERLYHYSIDPSCNKQMFPMCVVKPKSTKEISQIMKLCNDRRQRITIRAGGSAVSGGFLAKEQDVMISLERMNKILAINTIDRYATVEAGVVTADLAKELLKYNLCFPQNLSSATISCIGGNVAISSGSPKSLKYGSTKNYVLNLEVVLSDGQVIWTGKNVEKNATGYNLTQLFVGSEGTLGVITKIVLKLVPTQKELLIVVPFSESNRLFDFLKVFFIKGFTASSLEFLDKNGCELILRHLDDKNRFPNELGGVLWIEFESQTDHENMKKAEQLYDLINDYSEHEPFIAQTRSEMEALWKYRKEIGQASLNYAEFKDLDIVVPRSTIDQIFADVNEICVSFCLDYIIIGHIGNGNFHINIFKDQDSKVEVWEETLKKCSKAIFNKTIELGGQISGEHGIGRYNRSFFNDFTHSTNIKLMSEIKKIFDPQNILNSDNLFL